MTNIELDYKEQLNKEYDQCVYELAVAEINKSPTTTELIEKLHFISKQIATLDVEIMIAKLNDYNNSKKK